jgi:beta-glucosidase
MTRIDPLLAAMTLQEKIGQMTMAAAGFAVTGPVLAGDATLDIRAGLVGSLLNIYGVEPTRRVQRVALEQSRLGIPLFFGFDVIHGHRTIFPIPLAEAATFHPDLWEQTAREAAIEAAQDGVHLTFAPMLDVTRDPRWGRMAEGPGEDPFLASLYAAAKVRGFQGNDLAAIDHIAATAKHFVAYGAPTGGIDYMSADISDRSLHEIYLPPFESAIGARVAAIMPAFHDIAGVPMTANEPLLKDWLRHRLGFSGVLISDYNAIAELIEHGVASDMVEAATLALRAGIDIEMTSTAYRRGLPEALDRGLVGLEEIDASVRRILRLKEALGLFDAPFGRGGATDAEAEHAADRRRLARDVATRSIVLLSNNGLLPLSDPRRVAVVGPLANERVEMRGCWPGAGDPREPVTLFEGLRSAMPEADVVHAAGISIEDGDWSRVDGALDICRSADVVVLCVGEAALMSGEAASRASLDLPGRQKEFAEAVLALGKPVVAVLSSGRPLTVSWLIERAHATLATWFLGNEAGAALGDIVTGRVSPSGRLPVSWPRSLGQVPIFYAQRTSGRPATQPGRYASKYIDLPTTPLFPFGHGLSYGQFVYSDLMVGSERLGRNGTIEIMVSVANEGDATAEETVLLFIHEVVASVARPRMELKGFSKIELPPGGRGVVALVLPVSALQFPGRDFNPVLEPGTFEVLVGPCADRQKLVSATVTVSDDPVQGRGP